MTLDRDGAIKLARAVALAFGGQSYTPKTQEEAATWLPHGWVVAAIIQASGGSCRVDAAGNYIPDGLDMPPLPEDWYDGTPKRCPGSGNPSRVRYHGEVHEDGERVYLVRCPWCDSRQSPGMMPEHTFIPVRVEDLTFTTGKYLYGIEYEQHCATKGCPVSVSSSSGRTLCHMCMASENGRGMTAFSKCDGDHPGPRCFDPQCWQSCNDLPAYVDGELPPDRANKFREHLETCGTCPALIVEAEQMEARLSTLPPKETP